MHAANGVHIIYYTNSTRMTEMVDTILLLMFVYVLIYAFILDRFKLLKTILRITDFLITSVGWRISFELTIFLIGFLIIVFFKVCNRATWP